MCGIFGITTNNKSAKLTNIKSITNSFFKLSESRGKDASGLAITTEKTIEILKKSISASQLIKSKEYTQVFNKTIENYKNPYNQYISLFGHARMETDGSFNLSYNNQPVIKDNIVVIHNGIIVNSDILWRKNSDLKRKYQVDTEILNSLLRKYIKNGYSLINTIKQVYSQIEGAASIAIFTNDYNYLLLATNNGSLYYSYSKNNDFFMFASEQYFLDMIIKKHCSVIKQSTVKQIKPLSGIVINLKRLDKVHFCLKGKELIKKSFQKLQNNKKIIIINNKKKQTKKFQINNATIAKRNILTKIIEEEYKKNCLKINKLKRCSKCLLPETMPYIEYDKNGICNFCNNYKKLQYKGKQELEKKVRKYRKNSGKPDCIVAFSGGRDSSYALHYIKNELKMNPLAYSYDWGMLTDLGRRNQSIMTAKLGIEHIIISADITQKREYIKSNIKAWLKKPSLGTIPLFMAGDKQYFYYANKLMKQMNIELMFLCESPLERTDFKSGFCGILPKKDNHKFYALSIKNKIKMALFYAKEYLINPSYINRSLFDTAWAFGSYYFIPHNYISFYEYIKWNEEKITSTLKRYNWEIDNETSTTWRIGDGTAAFYNYIYYTMAGFTENDTFRSNQIRESEIKRSKGLSIINKDNKPRLGSLIWYANIIQIDLIKTIRAINNFPKLY